LAQAIFAQGARQSRCRPPPSCVESACCPMKRQLEPEHEGQRPSRKPLATSPRSSAAAHQPLQSRRLRGTFGAVVERLRPEHLADPAVSGALVELWTDAGGLLVLRGLAGLTPLQLCDFSGCFGRLHTGTEVDSAYYFEGLPVLRMGNARDDAGRLACYLANRSPIPDGKSLQYDPRTELPNWHTDSVFWEQPPIGSLFFCQQAPAEGGETLFADTTGAYAALPRELQAELERCEVVCSLAHQWAKKNKSSAHQSLAKKSPQELRAARARSRARRWPLALRHPETGKVAIYGMNMGTCAVLPRGSELPQERLDEMELEGAEDESLDILKGLLPHLSQPQFTVKWKWDVGDLVVWDNRSLFHAGTGFDDTKYTREMWRTTVLAKPGPTT